MHPLFKHVSTEYVYYTKTEPIQSNGHDCGLWVLAQMAAILRGFDITGLHENNMPMFRYYLQVLIARIPVPAH